MTCCRSVANWRTFIFQRKKNAKKVKEKNNIDIEFMKISLLFEKKTGRCVY